MLWQQIDIDSGEVIAACVSTEQLPFGARLLVTPETEVIEGVPNFVLWPLEVRTADEAARWTKRVRSGEDPLFVMKYQPELGVWCEIPRAQRGAK